MTSYATWYCLFAALALTAVQGSRFHASELGRSRNKLSAPPPLCDAEIVANACRMFNECTEQYYGTTADVSTDYLHAAELAEQLMVSKDSVVSYFQELKLVNSEDNHEAIALGAFAVKCTDLCEAIVQDIPKGEVPPSSDIGCYWFADETTPRCDVSLVQEEIKRLKFPEGDASTSGREAVTQEDNPDKRLIRGDADALAAATEADLKRLADLKYPSKLSRELRITLANLFRIYPPTQMQTHAVAPVQSTDSGSSTTTVGWELEVKKVAVKAQAYVATALNKMSCEKVPEPINYWFGKNEAATRKELRRLLTGIKALLSNVAFVYPGAHCRYGVFAYVDLDAPKNPQGQYLVHLCDTYLQADEAKKIQTLTHEASHHSPMFTNDVEYQGAPAYGKSACRSLAKADPVDALKNADTLCFFINDAATKDTFFYAGLEAPAKEASTQCDAGCEYMKFYCMGGCAGCAHCKTDAGATTSTTTTTTSKKAVVQPSTGTTTTTTAASKKAVATTSTTTTTTSKKAVVQPSTGTTTTTTAASKKAVVQPSTGTTRPVDQCPSWCSGMPTYCSGACETCSHCTADAPPTTAAPSIPTSQCSDFCLGMTTYCSGSCAQCPHCTTDKPAEDQPAEDRDQPAVTGKCEDWCKWSPTFCGSSCAGCTDRSC